MPYTIKDRLRSSIRRSDDHIFVRSDFDRFGAYRQVSRALAALEQERELIRAGYGIYAKPTSGTSLDDLVRSMRDRLGKRVRRLVTVDGVTVRIGEKSSSIHNAQAALDAFKLRLAEALVKSFDLSTVRAKSRCNLARWKSSGVWCSAYDEWLALVDYGTDAALVAAMTGQDEHANRLRQSPPYTGLLDPDTVARLREKDTA